MGAAGADSPCGGQVGQQAAPVFSRTKPPASTRSRCSGASFPEATRRRWAETYDLRLGRTQLPATNTIPAILTPRSSFRVRTRLWPSPTAPTRRAWLRPNGPIWVLEEGYPQARRDDPAAAATGHLQPANLSTSASSPRAGTARMIWRVTAVKGGSYRILRWQISAWVSTRPRSTPSAASPPAYFRGDDLSGQGAVDPRSGREGAHVVPHWISCSAAGILELPSKRTDRTVFCVDSGGAEFSSARSLVAPLVAPWRFPPPAWVRPPVQAARAAPRGPIARATARGPSTAAQPERPRSRGPGRACARSPGSASRWRSRRHQAFPSSSSWSSRQGTVRVLSKGSRLPRPFLNLRSGSGRAARAGPALDRLPAGLPRGRRFYVYYTDGDRRHQGRRVPPPDPDPGGPDTASPGDRDRHPDNTNHNGGQLQFLGSLLYFGTGDGGRAATRRQRPERTSLLGKLLRIDPRAQGGRAYPCPRGTRSSAGRAVTRSSLRTAQPVPVVVRPRAGRPRIAIADVGQDQFEEVNY